jgi:ankyrin repeat protein
LQAEPDHRQVIHQIEQASSERLKARADNGNTLLHMTIQRYGKLHETETFYDKKTLQQYERETVSIVTCLLQKGADIQARNDKQETPLHQAAQAGSVLLVGTLCHPATLLAYETKKGNSALHLASQGYHQYPKYYRLSQSGKKQSKKVLLFLEESYCRVIKLLHQNGAALDQNNRFMETPLHRAVAIARNPLLVETLLRLGADIQATDQDFNTVLHLATGSQLNTYLLTKLLLQNGANALLNKENKAGICPLHNVLAKEEYSDRSQTLGCLLEQRDILLNIRSNHLETPLHLAVLNVDPLNVKTLLEKGCETNARDLAGNTPLHVAVQKFEEYRTQVPVAKQKIKDMQAIVKHLIYHGADTEATNFSTIKPDALTQEPGLRKKMLHYQQRHLASRQHNKNREEPLLKHYLIVILSSQSNLERLHHRVTLELASGSTPLRETVLYQKYSPVYKEMTRSHQTASVYQETVVWNAQEVQADIADITQTIKEAKAEKDTARAVFFENLKRDATKTPLLFQQTLQALARKYQLATDRCQFYELLYSFMCDALCLKSSTPWIQLKHYWQQASNTLFEAAWQKASKNGLFFSGKGKIRIAAAIPY